MENISNEQTSSKTTDPLDTPQGLVAKANRAFAQGIDFIETDEDTAKFYCGEVPAAGFFMFRNVKCYVRGMKEHADRLTSLTSEDTLFGGKSMKA